MYRIDVNGAEVFYFTAEDPLPDETLEGKKIHGLWSGGEELNKVRAEHSDELRCIIALGPPPMDYCELYLLLWNNGQDLQALDSRVRQGTYRPEDFTPAVETWLQYVFCLSCDRPGSKPGNPHRRWLSLVVPNPINKTTYWQRWVHKRRNLTEAEANDFAMAEYADWNTSFDSLMCPVCQKTLGINVVRIYGLMETPPTPDSP